MLNYNTTRFGRKIHRTRGWTLFVVLAAFFIGGIYALIHYLPDPMDGFEADPDNPSQLEQAMDEAYSTSSRADDKQRQVEREVRRAEEGY